MRGGHDESDNMLNGLAMVASVITVIDYLFLFQDSVTFFEIIIGIGGIIAYYLFFSHSINSMEKLAKKIK